MSSSFALNNNPVGRSGFGPARIAALIVGVGALGALLFILSYFSLPTKEKEVVPPPQILSAAAAVQATSTAAEVPVRVAIPSIGVEAKVQSRGLATGNRMAAPTNYTDIGWYKYGVVPGDLGTAVMYGHFNNGLGLSGVFKNLDRVKMGDVVEVTTVDGSTLRFKISDIHTYPYQTVPPEVLGQGIQPKVARLSFITCSGKGIRDPSMGFTYTHRLVVIATLE